MPRMLPTLALAGFGVAIVSATAAVLLGGPHFVPSQHFRIDLPWRDGLSFSGDCAGDDRITTRSLPWTDGSGKVALDLAATVDWKQGNGHQLVVTGPDREVDRVRIDGDRVTSDCDSVDVSRLSVTLPGIEFRRWSVDGLGQLHLSGLAQPTLDLAVSGAALIDAAGVVPQTNLDVSGAASIDLANLVTQDLRASLAGASNLIANPAQSADIALSGAGLVKLLTRPRLYRAAISGLGQIDVPDQAAPVD